MSASFEAVHLHLSKIKDTLREIGEQEHQQALRAYLEVVQRQDEILVDFWNENQSDIMTDAKMEHELYESYMGLHPVAVATELRQEVHEMIQNMVVAQKDKDWRKLQECVEHMNLCAQILLYLEDIAHSFCLTSVLRALQEERSAREDTPSRSEIPREVKDKETFLEIVVPSLMDDQQKVLRYCVEHSGESCSYATLASLLVREDKKSPRISHCTTL